MEKFKTNTIDLLFILYTIEDKQQYKNKEISKCIDKLQNKIERLKGVKKNERIGNIKQYRDREQNNKFL